MVNSTCFTTTWGMIFLVQAPWANLCWLVGLSCCKGNQKTEEKREVDLDVFLGKLRISHGAERLLFFLFSRVPFFVNVWGLFWTTAGGEEWRRSDRFHHCFFFSCGAYNAFNVFSTINIIYKAFFPENFLPKKGIRIREASSKMPKKFSFWNH